jgi:Kef-type K+ transport system membrane component KefB
MHYDATLYLALLLVISKIVVDICKKFRMPPVVGLIAMGFICGKSGLNLATSQEASFEIETFANIGVVILLFIIGLETNITQLKKMGKTSFLIALGGVFVPLILGFLVVILFTGQIDRAIIMGSILTATSVGVTAITLSDLGKLASLEGKTIITSAILDDVIAIIILSILLGFVGVAERSFSITMVSLIVFFITSFLFGTYIIPPLLSYAWKSKVPNMTTAFAFGLMILFAWFADITQMAAITGAYICGVFIGRTRFNRLILKDTETIGNTLFIPIFFIFIGMDIVVDRSLFKNAFLFGALIFVFAGIVGKIVGSGLFAKLVGFSKSRSFVIGAGMIPRGEVALVIVSIASSGKNNILLPTDKASVILLVLITTIITPFLLNFGFDMVKKSKRSSPVFE